MILQDKKKFIVALPDKQVMCRKVWRITYFIFLLDVMTSSVIITHFTINAKRTNALRKYAKEFVLQFNYSLAFLKRIQAD